MKVQIGSFNQQNAEVIVKLSRIFVWSSTLKLYSAPVYLVDGDPGGCELLPEVHQLRLQLGISLEHQPRLVPQLGEAGGQRGRVPPGLAEHLQHDV